MTYADSFEKIIVVLINLVGFWLIFWVYITNKKEKLNQWFAAMTFFVVLWVDFAFLGYRATDIYSATIFYRINLGAVSLFVISFFYFYVIYFIKHGKGYNFLRKIVLYLGIIFALLSLFSDLIIKETIIREWGAEIIFGPANDLFNLYSLLVPLLVIYLLIKRYLSLSRVKMVKMHYFLTGTVIFVLLNILFNIASPIITGTVAYQHMGDYSVVFLCCFVGRFCFFGI